jgi:hypothetical protein
MMAAIPKIAPLAGIPKVAGIETSPSASAMIDKRCDGSACGIDESVLFTHLTLKVVGPIDTHATGLRAAQHEQTFAAERPTPTSTTAPGFAAWPGNPEGRYGLRLMSWALRLSTYEDTNPV